MRTNIEINDELLEKAMKSIGATTKKAAVEAGLEMLVRIKAQEGIRELRGIQWEGDLKKSRQNRFLDRD